MQKEPKNTQDSKKWMEPLFAGPYGENNDLFESVILEHFREHFYWRRNFHPSDLPAIDTASEYDQSYQLTTSRMKRELHKLSAKLKHSVPFFHPRYMGHMASDLFLPGLIAQMMTLLYNPNNVSNEAGSETIDMELKVGEQFAQLFGFNTDEKHYPCAWGHLTSGGTVANIEALWNLRSGRFIGFALGHSTDELKIKLNKHKKSAKSIHEMNDWELFNLPLDISLGYWQQFMQLATTESQQQLFEATLNKYRPESLGLATFSQRYWTIKSPIVLVPSTAHYSWKKAAQLLGLGTEQMVKVPVDRHMRMDYEALERILQQALVKQIPILAVVSVLGTTEFGTIDPVHEVVRLQQYFSEKGLYFPIHVDAAWGGYFATLFRKENGKNLSFAEASQSFSYFPSKETYAAITHLDKVDSITVDPHKLGYLPFGVGGVVFRNKLLCQIQEQKAAYVFDNRHAEKSFNDLGQFILEGSKPGAAAAAVYVSQQVTPLHNKAMGKIVAASIRNSEYFTDHFDAFKNKISAYAQVIMPVEPDTNLVTLSINPINNHSMAIANQFTRAIYQFLKVNPQRPVQTAEFLGSSTKLFRSNLTRAEATRLAMELSIDGKTFVEKVEDEKNQADFMFALRHTLMNPWIIQNQKGKNYIDMYLEYLGEIIQQVLLTEPFVSVCKPEVMTSGKKIKSASG
ncbi:MAG TPA: pyridoxal-dependent decarboxylase [Aeromonadales bacterium]|nr:pyridoxal-dependent decarboxylase [Aeromonadales bacterium]